MLPRTLVIVDTVTADSLTIVDRLSRLTVYFSMYVSCYSEFSPYSGHFAADRSSESGKKNQIGAKNKFPCILYIIFTSLRLI